MTSRRGGRIITFYSYKGGVGRTMALANVAWILAANGHRVLASDWDLETPGGLPRYYRPFLPRDALGSTGLIDHFTDFTDDLRHRGRPDEEFYLRHAGVEHAMSVEWTFPGSGRLNCLSAGRQDRDYHATLASFRWEDLDARFLGALRERWRREYDYVLIDSRSGMGSAVDICIRELPDILVSCFTLNDQSIDGAALTALHVARTAPSRGVRILPLPMRVNEQQTDAFTAGRELARSRFADVPHGLSADSLRRYWAENRIPHRTGYEHEEVLATFKDVPGDPDSLLTAYERLTSVITGGRVTRLPPLDESLRRYHLGSFVRPLSPEVTPVVLSSVPRDRMWADWARWVLTRAGFQVVPPSFGTDRQSGATVRRVMLVSSAYLKSPRSRADWPSTDTGQAPVLLRIDDGAVLPEPYARHTPVELASLDAGSARAAVLEAVGGRGRERPNDPGPSFPNSCPAVWQVPPRNPRFVGRDLQLDAVHDALAVSRRVAVRAAGLGMGRRQLAIEYVHRFRADYDLVWWVPAVTRHLVTTALARLARRLELPAAGGIDAAARRALSALEAGTPYGRWLLVYDDAADPDVLAGLLPLGPGRVLITARDTRWEKLGHPLVLERMGPMESADLLLGRVPSLGRVGADDLATALGDLPPLALDQAGAWLAENGAEDGVGEYLAQLRPGDRDEGVRGSGGSSPEGPARLAEAALRKRSPAAHRLLQLCCRFAPLSLPLSTVRSDAALAALRPYDTTLDATPRLDALVTELTRLCLAEADTSGNSLRVHRLVRHVVRAELPPAEWESALRDLHDILNAAAASE
ncbi:FxSxx-COOH system tetratricopeptide repeat protein [Streptomyces ipomoeae]|uniref:FxSxx-COOH system tetratricopeptide repeat protein n=1 Tax=Streptomyces ipomoeae TaxID=103232 RepID=UPI0029B1C134|nr:FxSxx-COOH system tetratricopeptide repeat protein [Streptomyces ipomoeae]MDX2820340.1 FxSxx-COOH system tetratricopeptide repeat protein [Streptomyces ipomoeae]MDX2879891.1 FxSxx-COOH system tetratricopeptide repeat protein [Streptomyces ipomoeae]